MRKRTVRLLGLNRGMGQVRMVSLVTPNFAASSSVVRYSFGGGGAAGGGGDGGDAGLSVRFWNGCMAAARAARLGAVSIMITTPRHRRHCPKFDSITSHQ